MYIYIYVYLFIKSKILILFSYLFVYQDKWGAKSIYFELGGPELTRVSGVSWCDLLEILSIYIKILYMFNKKMWGAYKS